MIWIDADACPVAIREVIFRASKRTSVPVTLVANVQVHANPSKRIRVIVVPAGADAADDKIIELMQRGDIVITQDIPLAARVVKKDGIAIGTRGQRFEDGQVQNYLASRDLAEQMRSAGIDTGGPKPAGQKDIQTFANSLDRTLTKRLKEIARTKATEPSGGDA
ncbi:MAG: YaiI/YqxD family protein [Planctomycetota bacterium]